MKARDIIVVGTSAGGLSALKNLVRELPPDLPATVFIVQHLSPSHSSVLPALLERAGKLKVSYPLDGERFIKSHVYVSFRGSGFPVTCHRHRADWRTR